jgi:hypothetical protein
VQFSLAHPRDQVATIDIQSPFQRAQLGFVVTGTPMRRRQVSEQCSRTGIGSDRLLERLRGRLEIALAKGVHALAVGCGRLLNRL